MSGEGHLVVRREDPHGRVVRPGTRVGDEGRLAEVELSGKALHRLRVKAVGVGHHGERIAREGIPVDGEDIEQPEAQIHGRSLP